MNLCVWCVSPFIPLHCILLRSVLLFLFLYIEVCVFVLHFIPLYSLRSISLHYSCMCVCVCVCVCVYPFNSGPFRKTQNTFQYLKKVIADVDVSYKIVIDILYKVLTLNTTNNVLLLNHILLHLKKLPPE